MGTSHGARRVTEARTHGDAHELEALRRRVRELESGCASRTDAHERPAQTAAMHRAVLASVLDPTITIDDHGTVLEASASVERVFGWRPEELVGRNVSVLMPEPHSAKHDGYLAEYRRTGRTTILGRTREFRVVRKDGSAIECELSVSRADVEGRTPVFTGSFRDVSERKRAERAETAVLRSLAQIGESASVLVHEIKNPITGIKAALRAVAQHLGEDDRAILADLVGRLQRLERIMRRTLSFTRPLELQRRTFAVGPWLAGALGTLRPVIEASGVDVSVLAPERSLSLDGDPQLLEEVVTNLVANSLEAVEELAGQHRVVVSACADGSAAVVLRVEDDGPGVPESLRTTLFKPFYTTKAKGAGLGLAFCKKVVDEHGGTIAVETSALGGAAFAVRLPSTSGD
jgi:two-component system sensor kinase FixL